jgi:hypothetical protein
MAVSGWITDPDSSDYSDVTIIAGAFAQAFDTAWNNAAQLNDLELACMTSVVQTDFNGRGPGPFTNTQFKDPTNWNIAARACIALILQCDIFFASQGITPGTGGGGAGDVTIVEDCSLLLPDGEATGGVATSPFSPVVYAIISMTCTNGQKVLLQFTPVYWLALSEENIGDFIQLQWQYSLNGADWVDFGLISNELGNDTIDAVVLCTLSRVYTHVGASVTVQFRVNVIRVSGGVPGDISARNGSLIATRFR